MKTLEKSVKKLLTLLMVSSFFLFVSCSDDGDDEDPAPAPTAGFTVSNEKPGVGEEVTFTNTSTDATAYTWSFGDGTTSMEENPSHTYESAGDFEVTLAVTGEGGSDQTSQTITVEQVAEPVEVYFADNTGDVFTMKKISGIGKEITLETAFETTGYVIHAMYSPTLDKVFYSDDDNGTIVSVNLDGSGSEDLITDIISPRDLTLNDEGNKLFYIDRGEGSVNAYDFASETTETLYDSTAFDLGFNPLPVGIAYHDGEIYVTAVEFDAESVWTGAADGSSATLTNIINFSEGGYGYEIEVDGNNDLLFIDNRNDSELITANLDGSGVSTLLSTGSEAKTYGLALDMDNGKVYFSTDEGFVVRANLDGSEEETLFEDAEAINRGLFIVQTQ